MNVSCTNAMIKRRDAQALKEKQEKKAQEKAKEGVK